MQGKQQIQPKLYYQVSLEDLVPAGNFYRHLSRELDLQFLYQATRSYYGREGQESIDPVVFFKILLVGYLNNIGSDRRLIEYCGNCLDVRLFLQYDLDDPMPWHSTISRTRQLYGEELFLELFRRVLALCVQKGMVRGKRQAVDSAFIKANASLDSLVEKEVVDDAGDYMDELNEGSEFKVSLARKKLVERHHAWKEAEYKDQPGGENKSGQSNQIDAPTDENGNLVRPKYLSNHTHYSPTDPDARISVKPGKARQLNYFGQLAVDDAHHVITGAAADFAHQRDSNCLPAILNQTIQNLNQHHLRVEQVAADAGYSSGEALAYCRIKGLDAWIPNFGQYKPDRPGFIYNQELDQYQCQRGNQAILTFKGIKTDSKGYHKMQYRSSQNICKNCPLRRECCGVSTKFKKIEDSIHKPLYDRMHAKFQANTAYAKRIVRIRSRTVEPVLGTLLNFLNMKRVNTRGIQLANKHVLMAALVYNLKKYMKFGRKKTLDKLQEMQAAAQNFAFSSLSILPNRFSGPGAVPDFETPNF